MQDNEEFQLISKALHASQKSLENIGYYNTPAFEQIDTAKEEMIKALAHATSIDHQIIIDTLFDKS